jgi:creatinine amidohydrolase
MVSWENTFDEVAQAKPEIALLPIGAIEQHSFHLPLATDYLAAQALGERVAQALGNCYLLPALPFSCSREHSDFAGSIWVRPATLAAIIEDIVDACHHQGIHKVVLLVAHGGNWIVKPTVREINLDRKGVKVIVTNPDSFTVGTGGQPDIHSGRSETSLILHLRPSLVKMDQVKPDFSPEQGREFLDYTGMAAVSPTGLWGAPSKGNAEEGKANLEAATWRAVEYIRKTFAEFDRLQPDQA